MGIVRVQNDQLIDGLSVFLESLGTFLGRGEDPIELLLAQSNPLGFFLRHIPLGDQLRGLFVVKECVLVGSGTGVGFGQTEVGHGQLWVVAQGLVKGTCCFHPNIRVQVGNALIVIGLGLSRVRAHLLVNVTGPVGECYRTLHDLRRGCPGDGCDL